MRIKWRTLITSIMTILLVHISLVSISGMHYPNYARIQLLCMLVIAAFLVLRIQMFLKKNAGYNIVLFIVAAAMFYSAFSSRNLADVHTLTILSNVAKIVIIFLFLEYIQNTNQFKNSLKVIYYCILAYCLMTDVLMLLSPMLFSGGDNYLVGNKFNVAYLHLYLLVLYCACFENNKKYSVLKRTKLNIHFLFIVVISLYTGTSTGVIGGILFLIFYIWNQGFMKWVAKPVTALLAIGFFDSILLINPAILNVPVIRYFIEVLLNKSLTLTGRLDIYSQVMAVVLMKPLWGFGKENNFLISQLYLGADALKAPNAQNGAIDYIISYGIIGLILMLVLLVMSIRNGAGKSNRAFSALLFVYIILSMVEITFRQEFFVTMALIAFGWNKESED